MEYCIRYFIVHKMQHYVGCSANMKTLPGGFIKIFPDLSKMRFFSTTSSTYFLSKGGKMAKKGN